MSFQAFLYAPSKESIRKTLLMDSTFNLNSDFTPQGDQPAAIEGICNFFEQSGKEHVLLGVTGSGKTFTMANVIKRLNQPALIIAPNKTLAAQLFTEFKNFFPDDAVGFFISYYDYYQPEAYVPSTDTYIAKDSSINEDIDKMRHQATQDLFEKKNTIIISSVSCIYGLGSPDAYSSLVVPLEAGMEISRDDLLRQLIDIQYSRNDVQLKRGHFRVRGDTVDIMPSNERENAIRVEFFGDEIDQLSIIESLTGNTISKTDTLSIYPNSHYVADKKDMRQIVKEILSDLGIRLRELKSQNKLVEYQRLEQRVMQDVESLEQIGFCSGIENYSRYLTGKSPGEPPPTLLDYFPEGFITIIDESHLTVPQINGMYKGDRSRKETLVNFGFRLPSALDNRPLNFNEFKERVDKVLYVSATPGKYEIDATDGAVSEQVIRPTGLIDPKVEIRSAKNQVDDLYTQISATVKTGRVLITTLTKKMAEDLTEYYRDMGIRVRYLHSDIVTLERANLLRDLRKGEYDVLIGINLLREGLDLPEVELVAIMDADKEGFLRSRSSLIQIVGRAARNSKARVIFYADKETDSMKAAITETERRRQIQLEHNEKHGITPQTVMKNIPDDLRAIYGLSEGQIEVKDSDLDKLQELGIKSRDELDKFISKKTKKMQKAAGELDFETAAEIRDEIKQLKEILFEL
jgi:excinuclease ABC subunit B